MGGVAPKSGAVALALREDFTAARLFNLGLAISVRRCQSCWLTGLGVQAGRKAKLVFQTFSPWLMQEVQTEEQTCRGKQLDTTRGNRQQTEIEVPA